MNTQSEHVDVLVVGGGLSGLMAARELQAAGKKVLVVDKGHGVGGRLATRRMGSGIADHGAQFFTVREAAFQAFVDGWLDEKLVYLWSMGFNRGSLDQPDEDGHPRYAVHGGMNALAKRVARDVNDVRTPVRVTSLQIDGSGWQVHDETGSIYHADAVLLTPPVPQSLALLDSGGVQLAAADRAALEDIQYAPCLTGLYRFDANADLPAPGAVQRHDAAVSWIANNQQKGISDGTPIITVQANPDCSRQLWDENDDHILDVLLADTRAFLPPDVQPIEGQLKRWRYSQPLQTYEARCLVAADVPPLVFAGDAFGGPRVEGAALSGLAAAQALLQ